MLLDSSRLACIEKETIDQARDVELAALYGVYKGCSCVQ
jgi:hypothetical protein